MTLRGVKTILAVLHHDNIGISIATNSRMSSALGEDHFNAKELKMSFQKVFLTQYERRNNEESQ